jgi:predicted nuclease of predicted toxin-antitoxin system
VATFLVDEDLPRTLSRLLTSMGIVAYDVRDVGLSGRPDGDIAAYASTNGYVIITRDVGFGGALHLAQRSFPGILVVRYPDAVSLQSLARDVTAARSARSVIQA